MFKDIDNFSNTAGLEELRNDITSELKNECAKVGFKIIDAHSRVQGTLKYGVDKGYLTEEEIKGKEGHIVTSDYFKRVTSGPLDVVIANLIMTIPFAVSTIVEFVYTKNNKEAGNAASNMGTNITIAGFVIMVIGFAFVAAMFIYANQIFL